MQCFGKSPKKQFAENTELGKQHKIEDDNSSFASKKSGLIGKSNNSEKEHQFLRAALNGQFQKIKDILDNNMDVNSCNSNGLNALHLASKGGHLEIVEYLLNNGANINAKTRKNNTALHIASLAGSFGVVKLLVDRGAIINEQSQNGFTPLYMAAQENHVEVVQYLLDAGADINLTTDDHFTPLAVAIQQGNDQTVTLLLNRSTQSKEKSPTSTNQRVTSSPHSTKSKVSPSWWDPKLPPPLHIATRKDDFNAVLLLLHHQTDITQAITQTSVNGFTALHVASYYGSVKVGRLLLENDAPPDMASKNNITPLHVASKWGQLTMVYLLLEYKANFECRTRDGLTPLHCAAKEGYKDICVVLIKAGADKSVKTKSGLSALHMATQNNSNVDLIKYFITELNMNPNEASLDYLTPLHFSAHSNSASIGKLLLNLAAYLNARAMNGFTAIHVATKRKNVEFVQMLLSLPTTTANTNNSAKKSLGLVDSQTEAGLTCLHIAAIVGSSDIIELLIKYDCQIDIGDDFGRTALQMAAVFDHCNIMIHLLDAGADINWQNKIGETAAIICVKRSNITSLNTLLKRININVNIKDNWGLTALDWSILIIEELWNGTKENTDEPSLNNAIEIFELLINETELEDMGKEPLCGVLAVECRRADIINKIIDKGIPLTKSEGLSMIHFAAKNNNEDILNILEPHIKMDEVAKLCAWQPEHFAAYFGSSDAFKWLLKRHSDPKLTMETSVTPMGNTCLHLAVQQMQVDIITIILGYQVDCQQCNIDGLSVLDFVCLIKDDAITRIFKDQFDYFDETFINTNPAKEMAREEVLEDEMLERLFVDAVSEIEFYGPPKLPEDSSEIHKTILGFLDYTSASDSIRRTDWSLRANDSLCKYKKVTLMDTARKHEFMLQSSQPSSLFSTLQSTITLQMDDDAFDDGFDVEKLDRQRVTDRPVNSGFLVSFLVDARGGCLQAQRFPKMKIFVPPDAALSPTRIIFRLVRPESMADKPVLSDCHGFACRILQVHSSTVRFQKPILIEMPYVAALENRERELIVFRKNFESNSWKEHSFKMDDADLKESFGPYYESLTSEESLKNNRIFRIATDEIPNYLSIVSVFNRDKMMIGPDGGFIECKQNKNIKVEFPAGSLMKKIPISLEVQNVPQDIISNITGSSNSLPLISMSSSNRITEASMSPIVTVEPKRRKFRNLITVHLPLPPTTNKSDLVNLRILFSISEQETKWEDVTEATELTVSNGIVTHSTKISAKVWLIYAPGFVAAELANRIYSLICPTPYIGRFLIYARRHDNNECQLRCVVLTDDSPVKTLECQESFQLIKTGPEVEVNATTRYLIDTAGNLVPITKSDEKFSINAIPFQENRLTMTIRTKTPDDPFNGKVAFRPMIAKRPITTLEIEVPTDLVEMESTLRKSNSQKKKLKDSYLENVKGCSDPIARTHLDLKVVADSVGSDWYRLAEELNLGKDNVALILQEEKSSEEEKAYLALLTWKQEFNEDDACGNILSEALRQIGREDVVKSCIGPIVIVEDDDEAANARYRLSGLTKRDSNDQKLDSYNGQNYTESVDESMIVETGDDASELFRLTEIGALSDISDKKSNSEEVLEPSLDEIVDMNKFHKSDELSTEAKVDAYLNLTDQLESLMPEPKLLVEHGAYNDEEDNEDFEENQCIAQMSCVPMNLNFGEDDNAFDPEAAENVNVVPSAKMELMSSVPGYLKFNDDDGDDNEIDNQLITPTSALQVSTAPAFGGEMDSSTDDITPQHSVLHEVYEGDPEVQQEVEEFEETLPDGRVAKRRLVKTVVTQKSVEKTTKNLTGEEASRMLEESNAADRDGNVVVEVTEEILPDGTRVERQVRTQLSSETKTLKESYPEDDLEKDKSTE